jgi:NAD(P)-dependent dehydrogenase (short-subunit alcohol dehydrogenase family)
MTLFDMSGKVAVITGSTRGIGRAMAERMAEHGAKVVISSRKQDVCDQVSKEVNDKFGKGTAVAIAANISSKENLQNLVNESNRAFGKIDVLVCNAASNPYYGPLGGISDEQFRKILDNNIVANNWLTSMVVPQMIERKDGAIIIVSSIGGLKGSTVLGAYAISKAADMQLARNLACEYGKHNVRVNCIAPGLIKTDFAKALWDNPENLKASTSRSPLLRIGSPDEIAGAAVFLGSAAGNFMTGQSMVIDGGATISWSCPGRGAAFLRCSAEPGPTPSARGVWAPDQQRTTPQRRRAAQHPGNVNQPHSTAAYTMLRSSVRKYSRWPGPCAINTANSSSLGSIQKKVPPIPLQKYWPTEPANGAMPSWVRTAKPSPKL